MTIYRVVIFAVVLVLTLMQYVSAHEWIEGQKGKDGQWCCGPGDCDMLGEDPSKTVEIVATGYHVRLWSSYWKHYYVDEIVPFSEALPSKDGKYWRCHDAQQKRRCFFSPPPST